MTDYSKMPDFEINKAVGKIVGYATAIEPCFEVVIINKNGKPFDPCNNPADAWPIIHGNLIEISPDYDFTDESEQELYPTGFWIANHVEMDGKSYYQSHNNPLRAAMIVFLMMKEREA